MGSKEQEARLQTIATDIQQTLSKLGHDLPGLSQKPVDSMIGSSARKPIPISDRDRIRKIILELSDEDWNILQPMLKKAEVDLLLYAVVNGDLELVQNLFKRKVDFKERYINFHKNEYGNFVTYRNSSLITIAIVNQQPEVAGFLIWMLEVDIFDEERLSPLSFAVWEHDTPMVESLLRAGADPLAPDKDGNYPLRRARAYRYRDIIDAIESIPKFSEKVRMDPMVQAKKIITETGHALGMRGNIPVIIPGTQEEIKISTEGNYSFDSASQLLSLLKVYQHHSSLSPDLQEIFHKIQETVNIPAQYLMGNSSITINNFVKRYQANEMVFIPTKWIEHGITVVLYKDYLVLSNRGEEIGETGTLLYKIKNTDLIDANFFHFLLPTGKPKTKDEVLKHIHAIIDPERPLVKFPTKEQKWGTCSFVNQKSATMAMIYLLELEKLEKLLKSSAKQDQRLLAKLKIRNLADAKSYAFSFSQKAYKNFTNFIRNKTLKDLISLCKKSSTPDFIKGIGTKLLITYLIAHRGQAKDRPSELRKRKMALEVERVKYILKTIPKNIADKIVLHLFNKRNINLYMEFLLRDPKTVDAMFDWPAELRSADVLNKFDDTGLNPILRSIKEGRMDLFQALLSKKEIELQLDKFEYGLIQYACIHNRADMMKMLLDRGAPLPLKDDTDRNLVALAITNNALKSLEFVLTLPQTDFYINFAFPIKGGARVTPIQYAITQANEKMVELLLSHPNIDVNLPNRDQGASLVTLAKETNNDRILKLVTDKVAEFSSRPRFST